MRFDSVAKRFANTGLLVITMLFATHKSTVGCYVVDSGVACECCDGGHQLPWCACCERSTVPSATLPDGSKFDGKSTGASFSQITRLAVSGEAASIQSGRFSSFVAVSALTRCVCLCRLVL